MKQVLVLCGGAIGASLRYIVSIMMPFEGFPFATLLVNCTGSFLLAYLTATSFAHGHKADEKRLFFGTGLLGSFTTLSAFSFELIELLQVHSSARLAMTYLVTSLFFGLIFVFLGFSLGNKRLQKKACDRR